MARLIFYSHDGYGIGHFRRNMTIARRVIELDPSSSVLLATGSKMAGHFDLTDGLDVLELPSLAKVSNGHYEARRLHLGAQEIRDLRRDLLDAAVRSFKPHAILVDKHPLGVHGELVHALRRLLSDGGRAALGLRDVLDDPATVRDEWTPSAVRAIETYYDRLLVYGQRGLLDPLEDYKLPDTVRRLSEFCGYVIDEAPAAAGVPPLPKGRRVVVACAGGGEDGAELLRTFAKAARGAPWAGVVVAGPLTSASDLVHLTALGAQAGVRVVRFVAGLSSWFELADAVVCMGGYNTLAEVVAAGARVICVPRVRPRTEQLIRARAFAAHGLLRLLAPDDLTPSTLRDAVDAALADGRERPRGSVVLDLRGADRAARQLLRLVEPAGALAPPLARTVA